MWQEKEDPIDWKLWEIKSRSKKSTPLTSVLSTPRPPWTGSSVSFWNEVRGRSRESSYKTGDVSTPHLSPSRTVPYTHTRVLDLTDSDEHFLCVNTHCTTLPFCTWSRGLSGPDNSHRVALFLPLGLCPRYMCHHPPQFFSTFPTSPWYIRGRSSTNVGIWTPSHHLPLREVGPL